MLNLFVMVRNFFLLMLGFWLPFLTGSFQISRPKIDSPQTGEALQGIVEVIGTSEIVGFQRAEVAFAYGADSSTWFLIADSDQPVRDGVLAAWDTTTIADGRYLLRVRVNTAEGDVVDVEVKELRVRNYTPIETSTPLPEALMAEPQVVLPEATPLPTPTNLPENPASVTLTKLSFSLVEGAAFVLIVFLVLGTYSAARRKRPRR
ncbi:MAG: hypothetical protein RBT34_05215 [Anaerolineaceae bacterium]|jgi:hypothetical protein|nr:hypothetical protein [Anaerolineaceae bacterium]